MSTIRDVAAHDGESSIRPRLRRAVEIGRDAALPADRMRDRLHLLATLAEDDVELSRIVEPHLDALAILDESGERRPEDADRSWGVFAAEAPGTRLCASPSGSDGGWVLTGEKAWCSLATHLDSALVTAWIDDDRRGLFAVDLGRASVAVTDVPWVARGLPNVISSPVVFDATPARPVGGPGWYLERPGFAWGGIGVAACWWGGALPVLRRLTDRLDESADDTLTTSRIGRVHRAMVGARDALIRAATEIDERDRASERVDRVQQSRRAAHVRGVVADAVDLVLETSYAVLGPTPLVFDADHARRVADLQLYTAQYHRGRDDSSLARGLARDTTRLSFGGGGW